MSIIDCANSSVPGNVHVHSPTQIRDQRLAMAECDLEGASMTPRRRRVRPGWGHQGVMAVPGAYEQNG